MKYYILALNKWSRMAISLAERMMKRTSLTNDSFQCQTTSTLCQSRLPWSSVCTHVIEYVYTIYMYMYKKPVCLDRTGCIDSMIQPSMKIKRQQRLRTPSTSLILPDSDHKRLHNIRAAPSRPGDETSSDHRFLAPRCTDIVSFVGGAVFNNK